MSDSRTAGEFVRSWDTTVQASKSKRDFEALIRRYGATGFTVSEDYASRTVVVAFGIRSANGELADVRLPISYDAVKKRLLKMPEFVRKYRDSDRSGAQAERVAWRHLLLWAEAALAATDAGLYTLQEAFFAHTMIATPNGGLIPAVDAVNAVKQLRARSGE